MPLGNLKSSTLSRSKLFESIALSLTFFKRNYAYAALSWKFVGNLSENLEMMPYKRILRIRFGVNNAKYEPCYGAEYTEITPCPVNNALSRCRNPENDTWFRCTSPYGRRFLGKMHEYLPRMIGKLSAQ